MNKQRVTMEDIAKSTHVSKMTVSRVLNSKPGVSDDTRQRILDAATDLGYPLPQQHVTYSVDAANVIALLIPDYPTIYLGEILRGISHAATQLNCDLMLYTQTLFNMAIDPQNTLSAFHTGLIDGALIIVPRNYETLIAEVTQYDLPYVIIDHRSETKHEASVTATNRKGMLEATRYLLALGHTKIGFITGRMDIACSQDRLQGFRDGLAEVGLTPDDDLILEGDFRQSSGFSLGRQLLQLDDPPTALLMSNDLMALGAMEAALVQGLTVGQDVSIIGFDDVFLANQSHPPLTTVRQPLKEMGSVALDILVSLQQHRPMLSLKYELPTELIIRETTGRPSR